jgi:hypothetical protein
MFCRDETGTAAFRVWRVSGTDKMPVDAVWQVADMFGDGNTAYRVVDPGRQQGDHGAYWIEELTLDGHMRFWVPWEVTFEVPAPDGSFISSKRGN